MAKRRRRRAAAAPSQSKENGTSSMQVVQFFVQQPPIFLLPAEILCTVFHYLRISCTSDTVRNCTKWIREHRWIPETTHVCHRWRQVAINDAALWAEVYVTPSHHLVRTLLSRARKNSGIHVVCDLLWVQSGEARQIERCRKLFKSDSLDNHRIVGISLLRMSPTRIAELLNPGLQNGSTEEANPNALTPLPNLVDLTFSQLAPFRLNYNVINPATIQRLSLTGFDVDWEFLKKCRSLTHLQLRHAADYYHPEPLGRAADALAALSQLDRLQTLKIVADGVRPQPHHCMVTKITPTERIVLPQCSTIILCHPASSWIGHIIGAITINQGHQPKWMISTAERIPSSQDDLPRSDVLLEMLSEHICWPIKAAEICMAYPKGLVQETGSLKLWGTTASFKVQQIPRVHFEIGVEDCCGLQSDIILHRFIQSFEYTYLENLDLHGFYLLPRAKSLARMFGGLPQLKHIRLTTRQCPIQIDHPTNLFQALIEGIGKGTAELPFPRLTSITVEAAFNLLVEWHLRGCLKLRSSFGAPSVRVILPSQYKPSRYWEGAVGQS